ncbi:MAG: hypothetical protein NTX61_07230 [Bacteroidetes bacterium]|nr:hypothetical protein [Bacteroidota bacterium]
MDILTCIVGLVFLIVVLGVLQGKKSVIYKILPRQHISDVSAGTRPTQEQITILCLDNQLSVIMPSKELGSRLETPFKKVRSNEISVLNKVGEKNKFSDYFYSYKVYYKLMAETYGWYKLVPFCIISKRQNINYISEKEIDTPDNRFLSLLSGFDFQKYWLDFMVDSSSIGIFRKARQLCSEKKYNIGWVTTSMKSITSDTMYAGDPGKYNENAPKDDIQSGTKY